MLIGDQIEGIFELRKVLVDVIVCCEDSSGCSN